MKVFGICRHRRVTHGLKLGLAINLVSLFYYFQPLYDLLDVYTITAVITVISVYGLSAGDTLEKGLNSVFATLVAGVFGVGAHYLASLFGQRGEAIILGLFLFLQGQITTYIKLFPKIKARYDFGLEAFNLALIEVSLSSYREDDILELAYHMLLAVFIGGFACVVISIYVCPAWAGEDLHNLIALYLEELANFLKGFEGEYFKTSEGGDSKDNRSLLEGYKRILRSKDTAEESLANSARWEPRHGKFQVHHPWSQYLKIGALTRKCAYKMSDLYDFLNSNIQASTEIQCMIQEACSQMSLESSKALMELALAIKTMNNPSSAETHIANSKTATKSLRSLLKSSLLTQEEWTVPSLLIEIGHDTQKIADSVKELASRAQFRECAEPDLPDVTLAEQECEKVPPHECVENGPHAILSSGELSFGECAGPDLADVPLAEQECEKVPPHECAENGFHAILSTGELSVGECAEPDLPDVPLI